MLKIREIRSDSELHDLSSVWDSLLGHRGEEVLQHTYDWVTTWWQHFQAGKELFVLVAEDGNEVVGIAPLFRMTGYRKGLLPFRRAYFLGEGFSDYGSFLLKGDRAGVCTEFFKHLAGRKTWHELRLQNIPQATGDIDRMNTAAAELGYAVNPNARKPTHCFYVDTTGNFDQYLQTTSRDVKGDIPRRLARIEDAGGFGLKFTGQVSLTELFCAMSDIHSKRQTDLGRASFYDNQQARGFVEAIKDTYHRRGWLDYIVMMLDGQVAAYMFGFRHGGVRYSWNVGFDPKYNQLSLGKVLAYLWIEDSFRRPEIAEFNFMRGDSEFKRKFTKTYRWNHHFITRHPRAFYTRGVALAERIFRPSK